MLGVRAARAARAPACRRAAAGAAAGFEFAPLTRLAVALAALLHDYRHRGVSNRFLVDAHDPLALLHSDSSPLERMRLAEAFGCCTRAARRAALGREYGKFRKMMIGMVLATDPARGFETVAAVRTAFPAAFAAAAHEPAAGAGAAEPRASRRSFDEPAAAGEPAPERCSRCSISSSRSPTSRTRCGRSRSTGAGAS